MSNQSKRSFTLPVLLILVTVLSTLVIMFYSKSLLHDQRMKTETGQRLTEGYNYTIMFVERLQAGAGGLLNAESEAERLEAKEQLGAAAIAGGEAERFLIEALPYSLKRDPGDEEKKSIQEAMDALLEQIGPAGEHDGPLTADERSNLSRISGVASNMAEALQTFRPPSGEAGYRQMETGGGWVEAAQSVFAMLESLGKQKR